eukprot:CAMPEP_0119501544 /NCGR_PEP_ID=MMETSP1344-20130328/23338_1 /TAXON_ID=236787 /ORGANISM="Florenciella parvula, Strain CCMP2471" /LENGTH=54 /DNA_ID=CAMNT_0007537705 /DNA_START=1 /DNA_END=162 /DNA_ORIENTATION=+
MLESTLRQEMGFDGFVVSDCGAIQWMGPWDGMGGHNYTSNLTESAATGVSAGTD